MVSSAAEKYTLVAAKLYGVEGGTLVDLGHKSAFDLLLKEARNQEVTALGNSYRVAGLYMLFLHGWAIQLCRRSLN